MNIFDVMEENGIENENVKFSDDEFLKDYVDINDFSDNQKLITEKEITGTYLSGHPLQKYSDYINKYIKVKSSDVIKDEDGNIEIEDGSKISIIGIIDSVVVAKAKRTGDEWAKLTISDLGGYFTVLVFNKKFVEYRELLKENNIVYVEGKLNIDERGDRGNIYLDKILSIDNYVKMIEEYNKPKKTSILISFDDFNDYKNKYELMHSILDKHVGNEYVKVLLKKEKKMKIINETPIKVSDNLIYLLKEKLIGNDITRLENKF